VKPWLAWVAYVALGALLALSLSWAPVSSADSDGGTVVVGSKNFAESRLLAEVFSQLIEARTDLQVERRLGLAGTQVCFQALESGAIDLYPEYTGTGLVSLLGEEPGGSATEVLNQVRREFLERWDLWWQAPLGFENAYELAVPQALAEEKGVRTISDLVPVAGDLTAGLGYEFAERPDGLPGLETTYGLHFREVRTLQQALKYQAAGSGAVNVLDVYTTDGRLLVHDLVVLEDDRGFFPPYEAAALVRGETLRNHPELGGVLGLLANALDEDTMRGLNLRLQEQGEEERVVAADALVALGLVATPSTEGAARDTKRSGFLRYLWQERGPLSQRLWEHLWLTGLALLLACAVAIPFGLLLERFPGAAEGWIRAIGVSQTIPSLALLAFLVPVFGVGALPAIVALWVYSLFPILRNTYTGVRDADPTAVEVGKALGMSRRQILGWIRLPLALPIILAGVRTAAVIAVGTATLAAFIGAGGLGEPIVSGLQLVDNYRILSGALPAAALAVVVDLGLGMLERRLRPRGM